MITPRPSCKTCGKETSRTGSRYGKGIFTCTNAACPDQFKVSYQRPSAGIPHLQKSNK